MSVLPHDQLVSYAEYLEIEERTGLRHEYLDGRVFAMSGGTPRHSAIKTNLIGWLWQALKGSPCRPYDSELKVRAPEEAFARYADAAVVCGEPIRDRRDPLAVMNPVVLIEVLSSSTEASDRGEKWFDYQSIPTLRHYLLVSQGTPRVEHFERQDDGSWRFTVHGAGDRVPLAALGVELPVDAIYENAPTPIVAGARRLDGTGAGVPDPRQRAAHEAGHLVYGLLNQVPVVYAWIEVGDLSRELGGRDEDQRFLDLDQKASHPEYFRYLVAGEVATELLLGEAAPGARCAGACAEECGLGDDWCDYASAAWRANQTSECPPIPSEELRSLLATAREEVLHTLQANIACLRWTSLQLLEALHCVTKDDVRDWLSAMSSANRTADGWGDRTA